jgi:hypothetical protein
LLNAGHIAWCQGKKTIAIDYYIRCIQSLHSHTETFTNLMNKDKIQLINNGIQADDYQLMIDEVLYRTDKKE